MTTLDPVQPSLPSASPPTPGSRRTGVLLAAGGVLVMSFDALLIRLVDASTWNVLFWRGWLTCLAFSVVMLVTRSMPVFTGGRRAVIAGLVVSLMYGINSGLFVFSISNTSTANTVVILASSPLFAALFSRVFLHERLDRRTLIAIATAIGGVAIIFTDSLGAPSWAGDLAAVALAISMGGVLTLLRCFPHLPHLAMLALSGAIAGLIAAPLAEPLTLPAFSYLWLLVMGLVQTPLASWMIMRAPRHLPAPEVSMFLLIESVLGPFWVWLVIAEAIAPLTLLGGAVILSAITVHTWVSLRSTRKSSSPDVYS